MWPPCGQTPPGSSPAAPQPNQLKTSVGGRKAAAKRPKKVEWDPKKKERVMAGKERHWPAVSEVHPRKNGGLAVPRPKRRKVPPRRRRTGWEEA
jgi:hypothetical protein